MRALSFASLPRHHPFRTADSARQKGKSSSDSNAAATRAQKPDATQPLLSAFFGSKEKVGGLGGASGAGGGGVGSNNKAGKAGKGVQDGRSKERLLKGQGEHEGESQDIIPVSKRSPNAHGRVDSSCFCYKAYPGRIG